MKDLTERQIEILDAALALLGADGLSKLTLRNIAARVGMTEPGVYRHFPHKLALIQALLDRMEEAMKPHFSRLEEGASLEEGLTQFFEGLFGQFEGNPSLGTLVFSDEVFHTLPEVRPYFLEFLQRNQGRLTSCLETLQGKGICRKDLSPPQLALVLMGCLRLSISRWLLNSEGFRPREAVENLTSLLSKLLRLE